MLKRFLYKRKTNSLIRRFESGRSMNADELAELAWPTSEKGMDTFHNRVIATLEERVAGGDQSVVEAVFRRVEKECEKERTSMPDVDARYPYYATPFSLSYDVSWWPLNPLARLADVDIVPALQAPHDSIRPSV